MPLTNVSNSNRRGERYGPGEYLPPKSQLVSWSLSKAHHWIAAAAMAASAPMTTSHRVRSMNSNAPAMKKAP